MLTVHLCSVAASGDGSVKLWDVALGEGKPIKNYHEHEHEVYSVDWNLVNKVPLLESWQCALSEHGVRNCSSLEHGMTESNCGV